MEEEVIDNVSNTYLVLRKMKEEYSSLLGKISDSKFNNKLISILKNICTVNFINDAFTKTIDELKEFKDFSICQEVYYSSKLKKRFNLLLLEKDRQRILLNYLESPKNFESVEENYIPDTWLKYEYSSSLEKKHGKYTVINTFDSLLSFAKLNKLTKISEVNRIFFKQFIDSIESTGNKLENGIIDTCFDIYTPEDEKNLYEYAVLDHVILVIKYDKEQSI